MKITFLLGHAHGRGGAVRTVLNTAGALAERGHDVEVWSVVRRRSSPAFPLPPKVTVRYLTRPGRVLARGWPRPDRLAARLLRQQLQRHPSRLLPPTDKLWGFVSLWTDLVLRRRFRRLREGVVIGTNPGLNIVVSRLARPEVVAVGQEHLNLGRRTSAVRAMLQPAYRRLDALVTLTEGDARAYREFLGDGVHVAAIPNAVPTLQSAPDPVLRDDAVAVAAGRLKKQKGFDLLIRAWRKVADHHPEWRLEIHGLGPERDRLQALVEELGLADHVQLMGFTKNFPARLARASLFVLSSRYEGFPMVLLEALSCGVPVVATDCPTGPAEMIDDGVTGLLVRPRSPAALAAGILRAIDEPGLRARLGPAARSSAEQYGRDATAARWESLLADLLAQHRPGSSLRRRALRRTSVSDDATEHE